MKKTAYLLLLSLLSLISCSDEPQPLETTRSENSELSKKVTAKASVTGLTNFKVADLAIPSGGLPDGKRFYRDGSLRSNVAYYPYGITTETKDSKKRIRFYVKPTSPTSSLVGTQYAYHHRAEFTRWPWLINLPLKTEEWLGFSYIFPTAAEAFTQNQTPVSIYQNHAGRVPGQAVCPPALQLEIAYPDQLRSYLDPYYRTPLGGEIMIINQVRGIRWVAPGVRVVAGARINIVIQIVYGSGNDGLFNVWINGKLMEYPGSPTNPSIPKGNVGSTVWPAQSPAVAVGGNSKLGLYHHQMTSKTGVDKNAKKGHTHMRVWMTDWNDVFRKPGDWDYKNSNAYGAVDTSNYP